MAGSQSNYWGQHDLNRLCFGLSADIEHNLKGPQEQQLTKEYNSNIALSQSPCYSDTFRLTPDNFLLPGDGDQVVPSSQRRSVFGGHQKEPKPLPPLPDAEELMSDEAADSEVEFFTSDRQRLLPKSCPKAISRGGSSSSRESGQVNYAYQESSLRADAARRGPLCFSWPSREDKASRGSRFSANNWPFAVQRDDSRDVALAAGDVSSASQFSFSGQAPQPHGCPPDKPQVPPRIPIPPKPSSLLKTLSPGEEDKPPKIPPRVPLIPPCPPRTPSPKTLPIYINGVMPATQSFAANPKYVSKALQRQQAERAPPATHFSPRIVPILKDGRQASATHYILLPPGQPPHTDRRDRLLSEPNRTATSWQKR